LLLTANLLGINWIELLSELLELMQIGDSDRSTSSCESLLEVVTLDLWHWVVGLLHILVRLVTSSLGCESSSVFFGVDRLSDS